MDTTTIVGIVVAVVLALLILAVLVWALRSRAEQRRHAEAQRIREQVDQVSQQVQRREAFADETETKARAAQAEADAKAAEAARLQQRAQDHRSNVTDARHALDEQRAHADSIDPRVEARPEEQRNEGPGMRPVEQRTEGSGMHPGEGGLSDNPRVGER
jgi:FtsZ-interacting cell division protein ZipA